MDPVSPGDLPPSVTICQCSCPFCCQSLSYRWNRSVKRKAEFESPDTASSSGVTRVQTESEVTVLRETITHQMEMIQGLSSELDEERNAASSAANEAMAMILKLQREKAEALMDARQFKRYAEEKMAHDDEELYSLEDLLMQRDKMLESLSSKLYTYRLRFQRLGFPDSDFEEDFDELSLNEYPPLKCTAQTPVQVRNEEVMEEIYEFGENPHEDLNVLEERIFNLEKQEDQESQKDDDHDQGNDDESSDRVYMVDKVYGPSETPRIRVSDEKDVDIKKLYMRLDALEADRESMRQTLISMRTEKTQLVLLQEIAQHLSKEAVGRDGNIVVKKKKSFLETFSILTLFKWLFKLVYKQPRIRYAFGLSTRNVGLLVILDKTYHQMNQLRCHAKVRITRK